MRKFGEFKDSQFVKRITPNPNEIEAIKKDSIERFETFWSQRGNKAMAKYVFENLYEALRELSECIALIGGYKIYSHDITISYLYESGYITEPDMHKFDSFRKLRNQSKYYGDDISYEKLVESTDHFRRLKNILEKLVNQQRKVL